VSEYAWAAPAPALRGVVAWYTGYRQEGVPPASHRGLPSPYLTLIITLDDPLVVARHPDPAAPAGCYTTLIGGLHTSPALITHDGRQSGVQVGLSPLGARVAGAWRLLVGSGGAIRVGELAERVGWSPRYLQRRLLAETGLTPKAAARVARFDRTRRLLQRTAGAGHAPALADLAAACGYYDQAHLAREFRELASCPPTAWLAEEFRNVQASPDALEEGSRA